MKKKYIAVLLTVLTLSVLVLVIIELTGISRSSLLGHHKDELGVVYSKDGIVYHGEITPEQTKTREQIVSKMPKTTIQFYETRHSFGTVSQDKVVKHAFKFKNTGINPLMISKTDVTCGCTVPNFPLDPIPPGQDGEMTVEFNTMGKKGFQQKNIIVHANTIPEAVTIGIEADVVEAK
jgi:hypothetical protein